MHFADSIVIFILALILFGPKKLPEIGRQLGKLLVEFRRASNEFKAQIDDELRVMEQQDRQKKLEEAAAKSTTVEATNQPAIMPPSVPPPSIQPPSTGTVVSTSYPFSAVTPPELPAEVATEKAAVHTPAFETPAFEPSTTHSNGSNGHTPIAPENEQASIHHG